MQCTNHLKQIMLAIHNYHDTQGSMPAGQCEIPHSNKSALTGSWVGNSRCWSAQFIIFPYMEQNATYDAIASMRVGQYYAGEAYGHHWDWADWHYFRIDKQISTFRCPSDSNKCHMGGASTAYLGVMNTSYLASRGDCTYHNGSWTAYSPNDHQQRSNRRSAFPCLFWHNFSAIVDGLSNTVGFSEGVISADTGRGIKDCVAHSAAADPDNNPLKACALSNLTDASDRSTIKSSITTVYNVRGSRLTYGVSAYSAFSTVMPPNNPACISSASWAGGVNAYGIFAPTSNHMGGVNCAVLDGAVRFVPDTVDCGTLTAKQADYGTPIDSPYGVWGAFGSICGGESKSL